MANPYDDVELTPRGMRALAHPTRLAILSRLQKAGPSTATALAPEVGATPSVTSWHLRHLAEHGLVRDAAVESDGRQRWWEAVGRGFRFTPPSDDAGRDAAALLSRMMFDQARDLPEQWSHEVEPLLEDVWRRAAGLSNTTIVATAAEVERIEAAIEEVLAPYVLRKSSGETVPDARAVRLLRYVLPAAATPGAEDQE
ncbi:helix-turn-helix domain-containing protein [Pedococcus sp. KACC 23699]|uniref:Helix-turn-helix domain-containing protein n=1 Tax=Pedococcus sp. KACC 23699 TaxID=3149228 RepID=A0AAU7JUB1_9MICO